MDPVVGDLVVRCKSMAKELKIATERMEDAESRMRRPNVHIIGMPEKIEKPNIVIR